MKLQDANTSDGSYKAFSRVMEKAAFWYGWNTGVARCSIIPVASTALGLACYCLGYSETGSKCFLLTVWAVLILALMWNISNARLRHLQIQRDSILNGCDNQ